MSKRAVEISYELLKEFITQGYKLEVVECLQGIPEDAVLVEMFPKATLNPIIVMVFDSPLWDSEPSKYTASCPISGKVPLHNIQFREHYHKELYGTTLTVNGDRFLIESKMPVQVKAESKNNHTGVLYGSVLAKAGHWVEIEELT